ncbi:MAG: 3-octaprenyl-4-hydroxybenzoate carboxy-lyase [Clostridia bacterium]|jgi:4-hydroxy-3-polyprenylbenzoate decarboxylase|nr:3-octaprenyl-4-hydroxybenzoate carboxy-lyase [Clostridia bacterium]
MKRYSIGITGASGSILAKHLVSFMASMEVELHVIVTEMGEKVFEYETGNTFEIFIQSLRHQPGKIILYKNNDLFASVASGSFHIDAMIILPCSMGTAGKIAAGTGGNLLCRAADVCLKEKVRLVISPREAPLNTIHLRNLVTLSECGAVILPPVPMFYSKKETYIELIEGIVGRILKSAGISNTLFTEWRN